MQNTKTSVKQGDYVVFDPTGRGLLDCAVVGRVESVYEDWDAVDGDDGSTVEVMQVVVNGSGERIAVTSIFRVLTNREP